MSDSTTTIVEKCRKALRISVDAYDEELELLASAARLRLVSAGVEKDVADADDNPLVTLAVEIYVKAHFGMDNPDASWYTESFETIATQLKGTTAYGQAMTQEVAHEQLV